MRQRSYSKTVRERIPAPSAAATRRTNAAARAEAEGKRGEGVVLELAVALLVAQPALGQEVVGPLEVLAAPARRVVVHHAQRL